MDNVWRITLGDRSFSAAGPRLWNDLPPGLLRPGLTFHSFRPALKSHLFGNSKQTAANTATLARADSKTCRNDLEPLNDGVMSVK